MAIFGPKRGRGTRAVTLRIASDSSQELRFQLRSRSLWLRLTLCFLALVAMLVAVQAWQAPFPFRLDDEPSFGITASIPFSHVNKAATQRAREKGAESVPYVFGHDPTSWRRVPQDLHASLVQFAQAQDVSQLSPETRAAFFAPVAMISPEGKAPSQAASRTEREISFQALKQVASNEDQLRDVVKSFGEFLSPVETRGLIRPEHLPPGMLMTDLVTLVPRTGPPSTHPAVAVILTQLLAPTGLLHDRWALFPNLQPIRAELEHFLIARAPETLQFNAPATQAAREAARLAVPPILDTFNVGDVLVRPGERVDEGKLELLRTQYEEAEKLVPWSQRALRVVTVFVLFLVLAVLNGYHFVRNEPRLVRSSGRLGVYLVTCVLTVAVARLVSYDPWRAEVAPVLAIVMVFAIAYDQVLATVTAFTLSLVVILSTTGDINRLVLLMSVCTTAIILLPSVSSRSTVVLVGMCSAATFFLIFWGTAITRDQTVTGIWSDPVQWMQSLRGFGWCLAAGFLVSGSLPFIESIFGVVTDISLLELGDVSHPLLQELVRRAPGTYNHSITVASIAETAADSIGANGLLVRVGAYFHDIGKMLKPHYFVENNLAGAENRHTHLAPAMSTLIIIGHVKDGIDLADQHNLPQPLMDFIEQHHGTTLVEYFYREATKQAETDPDHRTDAEESNFRYPGPKPQSREAAVLMVADAVEGASRALSEPTPKRIERLVHDIAMKRLLDGQFDESGLTFTELSRIEDSLTKSLIAMYHGRIKYPEQRTA